MEGSLQVKSELCGQQFARNACCVMSLFKVIAVLIKRIEIGVKSGKNKRFTIYNLD